MPDPSDGSYYWLQGTRWNEQDLQDPNDPNSARVGEAFVPAAALADPTSTRSNALYYGGSYGASESDINRARQLGYRAQERGGPVMDPSQMNASRGQLSELARGYQTLAAGDPNSVNQQQLRRGYGAANAQIGAVANSARGGGIASALAQRTAGNQVGENSQNQVVQSQNLMAQEQQNAYANLNALGGQMRGLDSQAAFGQAQLEAEQRARNDAMTAEYERQQNAIAASGMQGQANRMGQRAQTLQTAYGQSTAEANAQRARDSLATNTALGLGSAGASAAGQIWNQANQGNSSTTTGFDPNKKDFAWSG